MKKQQLPQSQNRLTLQQAKKLGLLKNLQSRNKYGNVRTEYNGRTFHSKKEAERARELDMLVAAGQVKGWQPQPKFSLEVKGEKICTYVADFRVEYPDGSVEIEDVKGVLTAVYKIKKKLMKALYGIEIKEI